MKKIAIHKKKPIKKKVNWTVKFLRPVYIAALYIFAVSQIKYFELTMIEEIGVLFGLIVVLNWINNAAKKR